MFLTEDQRKTKNSGQFISDKSPGLRAKQYSIDLSGHKLRGLKSPPLPKRNSKVNKFKTGYSHKSGSNLQSSHSSHLKKYKFIDESPTMSLISKHRNKKYNMMNLTSGSKLTFTPVASPTDNREKHKLVNMSKIKNRKRNMSNITLNPIKSKAGLEIG